MSLTDMFDDVKADFSGVSGNRDLSVTFVKQKAFTEGKYLE